jgi:hypothetical protein
MQRLHGEYALLFNRRHGKVGHMFQGRFVERFATMGGEPERVYRELVDG